MRVSASRAESKDSKALDSAIFALQKSHQCGGALAPTNTRPFLFAQTSDDEKLGNIRENVNLRG